MLPHCPMIALSQFCLTQSDKRHVFRKIRDTGTLANQGLSLALLTIYDMCKAVDRGMVITDVKLLEKHGGKSGDWVAGA